MSVQVQDVYLYNPTHEPRKSLRTKLRPNHQRVFKSRSISEHSNSDGSIQKVDPKVGTWQDFTMLHRVFVLLLLLL